jgi:hypothetical protein
MPIPGLYNLLFLTLMGSNKNKSTNLLLSKNESEFKIQISFGNQKE